MIQFQTVCFGIFGCVLATAAHSQTGEVLLKVVSSAKIPVPGTIFLSPGEKVVGKTSSAGEYRLKHTCEVGHTFKAVPADRSEYYDSKSTPCSKVVELLVLPRPTEEFAALGSIYFAEVPLTKQQPKKPQVFAGVYGGIYTAQSDVDIGDTLSSPKCQVTVTRKYDIGYLDTKDNAWRQVQITGVKPSLPISPETKYFFPTSCEAAQPRILELKNSATDDLNSKFKQYYQLNSGAIESAVNAEFQKGGSKGKF
jgi:hypothetical protein